MASIVDKRGPKTYYPTHRNAQVSHHLIKSVGDKAR